MANDDDRSRGGAPTARYPNRRRRIVVGTVGAAAVLGVGAYAATAQLVSDKSTAVREVVVAPAASADPELAPVSASSSQPDESPTSPTPDDASPARGEVRHGPATRKEIDRMREKIEEARKKQEKAGIKVTKPLPPPPKVIPESAVKTRIEKTKDDYLRITTARDDLTGQKDLRIVAEDGIETKGVTCAQRFKFAVNTEPRLIPNMMVCWRVSAKRSVQVVGVTYNGKNPSPASLAPIVNREWEKLG